MKIKTAKADYRTVCRLSRPVHKKPLRPGICFRTLVRLAAQPDLWATHFTYEDHTPKGLLRRPCLVLMNHSSFLDLEIASRILYPRPYGIVCTSDGLVGKEWLMRHVGCIPTQKFVSDLTLVHDMKYALEKKHMSVLMYPEASYSFDGCATRLPDSLPGLIRLLRVPVVMIRTDGAFLRDPLYNGLQKRKVRVRATVTCLVPPERLADIQEPEIRARLQEAFDFDHFTAQEQAGIQITEPFRADGLERILYTCPVCGQEGKMQGKGTQLICHACGASWRMDTLGRLLPQAKAFSIGGTETKALSGIQSASGTQVPLPEGVDFTHIPAWYAWERRLVHEALCHGSYRLDVPVRIAMMVNYKAIYMVGEGRLTHSAEGFELTGCHGALHYTQKPLASYGLYADYFWYELGDVICIGNRDALYYCFPPMGTPVAKARLAAEELFMIKMKERRVAVPVG